MPCAQEKVLVAMSGGVDSSTAAALLVREGWDVVGATFRLPHYGPEDGGERSCCGRKGMDDARAIADRLGIPFYPLDYREKFEKTVLANFRSEYLRGRTPNPCVRCNDWLKFGFMLQAAAAVEAEYIATGHYVRNALDEATGRRQLRKGRAPDDQSYFLFSLSQDQLARAMFPLGDLDKTRVRATAQELGLPVHDKPGSQDLCFLPDGGYREVLRGQCPELFRPGPFVHVSGRVLGRHDGIACYTVGQRKGLRLPWTAPLYVVEIDAEGNRVIVGERGHVMRSALTVTDLNWIATAPPAQPLRAGVSIRFRHGPAPAALEPVGENGVRVTFDRPQEAPAPGQAAVFYDGDLVLGGGFIEGSE